MNSLGRLALGLFDVYARQHHAGDFGCRAAADEVYPEVGEFNGCFREAWFRS